MLIYNYSKLINISNKGFNMEYIDYETGEIIQDAYETVTFNAKNHDFVVHRNPNEAKDAEQLKEFCKAIGEKASQVAHVGIMEYKDCLKKDYDVVVKMARIIKYRNIFFMNIDELCELFGLDNNKNLNRHMKHLEKRQIIHYTKMSQKDYKIMLNPKLFYRGNQNTREQMIIEEQWVIDPVSQVSVCDAELVSPDYIPKQMDKELETVCEKNDEIIRELIEENGVVSPNSDHQIMTQSNKSKINKVLFMKEDTFVLNYVL